MVGKGRVLEQEPEQWTEEVSGLQRAWYTMYCTARLYILAPRAHRSALHTKLDPELFGALLRATSCTSALAAILRPTSTSYKRQAT